jgi:arylsulfatase A-like enzyme
MAGSETILMSGPFFHASGASEEAPNLLVLMVDGLSARHVSGFGYARETTPRLDAFSRDTHTYSHVFTPALEAMAPSLSLLTGLTPLRHGYLGAHLGPLPEKVRPLTQLLQDQGYVTAAFTEGQAPADADLVYGSGFERGFELFDDSYTLHSPQRRSNTPAAPVPAGSHLTLNKAGDWIENHRGQRFFLFVRLREMAKLSYTNRYGQGFVQSPRYPRPIDVYDTAIRYLDEQIGLFLERLDLMGLSGNTAILITSPYGYDLTGGWGAEAKRQLSEPCLQVPVYLRVPGRAGGTHTILTSMEDVGVALAGIMGINFPHAPTGSNVLTSIAGGEPISMGGDPLMLSLRTQRWRYLWNSGRPPFSLAATGTPEPQGLLDIDYYLRNWAQRNNVARQSALVDLYTNRLETYLRENVGQYLESTATGPSGQTLDIFAPDAAGEPAMDAGPS